MFSFPGICPHCHSDRGFHAFGMSAYQSAKDDYLDCSIIREQLQDKKGISATGNFVAEYSLAGICLTCSKPVVACCASTIRVRGEIGACINDNGRTTRQEVFVRQIWPEPVQPWSHSSLPEEASASFIDLQNMVWEGKRPHFIIAGCRCVLEASARALGGEGKVLYQRIEDLHHKGVIPTVLKDWAAIIRRFGNEATHEMAGTPDEAKELVEFTKVFLQFSFELPDTISKTRAAHS